MDSNKETIVYDMKHQSNMWFIEIKTLVFIWYCTLVQFSFTYIRSYCVM